MQLVMQVLGSLMLLFAVGISADSSPKPINVPVVTKYSTTEVSTAHQDETMSLIGLLCKQSKGMAVNVTVMLINNPDWDPTYGVFRYYVVDAPGKTASSALCTNLKSDGTAGPTCLIKAWPSTNDIYIKGTAGGVEAISFTLDAEMFPSSSAEAALIRSQATRPKHYNPKYFQHPKFPMTERDPVYLTEIVTIASIQSIVYKGKALLNFTFCPTPKTGSRYEVRGTVTGIDGQSSYTQYLCTSLPCVVDGANVIAHNGRQVPSNTVTTASGQWQNLYALIVCWGGVYDPVKDNYYGGFLFNANQLMST
ncbi:uncharacterized protein LOC117301530 [Asterias rubens]|uniref:uncharacterized protein LOC117301530 n=1 Tax=Asterias rubens TaxID=7604 RepID=UPI001454E90C|nr:uncharacterized protein LOC117301530 [Asterias rubens]